MRARLITAGACLFLALPGCSRAKRVSTGPDTGVRGDASTEAGVVDASADSGADAGAAPLSACFAPFADLPDCEEFSGSSLPQSTRTGVLLRAAAVGEGVQFQLMGGLAIAASSTEDGVEVPRVIRLKPDTAMVDSQVLGLEWDSGSGGTVELRDVWGLASPDAALGADVFALACREDTGCVVLAADSGAEDTLRPMLQLEDSGESTPSGLVAWEGALCVYGAGIHCHDGTRWTRRADDDAERLLRDMSFGDGFAVAVGDGGRVLVDEGDGFVAATNLSAGGTDLRVVSTHSGAIEAGSDRELWRRTESGVWSRCALDVGDLVEFGPILVADTSGRLVHYALNVDSQVREYCAYSQLPEEPLLSGSFAPCGLSRNPMLLSASTLWIAEGTSLGCVVTP